MNPLRRLFSARAPSAPLNTSRNVDTTTWAATASTEQIVARIDAAEREAFLWHVASVHMTPKDRDDLVQVADMLQRGGYRRPE